MFEVIKCVPRLFIQGSCLIIGKRGFSPFKLSQTSRGFLTSTMNYEKAVEALQSNPYYDKYSKKITELQKTLPEEFMTRLEGAEKNKKPNTKPVTSTTPLAGQPGNAKVGSTSFIKRKVLSDVMKVDLIANKSSEEIKEIWLDFHKSKDYIAASVPRANFEMIITRGGKYPLFILPLPRDHGYEFILCQFCGNEVHFTPLISYQTHKENAPECLTVVYFPDLKDDKGIVLMRGEFNKDILTPLQAQCLANELQLYYGEDNEKRTKLLERFTDNPDEFKHMDLIANLETLSL